MIKLDNHMLIRSFYWFGLIMGSFGFFTEISQRIIYMSTDFYLKLAMVSLLAAISLSKIEESKS
ncbi:MAG: hypothetical protein V1907_00680 [Candidatus Kerfeldbacteria bacterium]